MRTTEEIQPLWKEYFSKGQPIEIRNRLVEHYRPLVHIMAAKLDQKFPPCIAYDEICSAGYDGLIQAVESFDESVGSKFETYCQQRINGAVIDWIRTIDFQSRTIRSFERQRNGRVSYLESNLERPPTEHEIAQSMGITSERYQQLNNLSRAGRSWQLSALESASQSEDSQLEFEDTSVEMPYNKTGRKMITDYLTRGLDKDEKLSLILYYTEELTMREIGQVLGLSESRVSQIHKEALKKLRRRFSEGFVEV